MNKIIKEKTPIVYDVILYKRSKDCGFSRNYDSLNVLDYDVESAIEQVKNRGLEKDVFIGEVRYITYLN